MSINQSRLLENIEQLKSGKNIPFSITYITICGTPELWHEEITYDYNINQTYSTLRSQVDQGGSAIGKWQGNASIELFNELIKAFEISEIWKAKSEPALPGGELITWSFNIGEDKNNDTFDIYFTAESPLLMKLQSLNTLMRRIPYWLKQEVSAANITCSTLIDKSVVHICLKNNGLKTCSIPNPLTIDWTDETYLKIEVAKPEDPNNPTGLGLIYKSLNLKYPDKLEEKWQQNSLDLMPQETLIFPLSAKITDDMSSHYLRAVFSDYRIVNKNKNIQNKEPQTIALRGRVFSFEEII
ncbi:MAG: hypothetical protein QM500_17265 [Methylococcales bacterium]